MVHIKTAAEYDEAIKGDFVIVDFYADWCGPCKMMAEVFQEFEEQNPDYKIISVDVDRFGSIARNERVLSIPTIKIFSNGEVKEEKQGFMRLDELVSFIDENK